jgi:hypothetical protein
VPEIRAAGRRALPPVGAKGPVAGSLSHGNFDPPSGNSCLPESRLIPLVYVLLTMLNTE